MRSNKKDFGTWIYEFNQLRENIFIDKWTFGNHVAYMDLYIFKGNNFFDTGILSIKVYIKSLKIVTCIFHIKAPIQDTQYKKLCLRGIKTLHQGKYGRNQFPENQK